MMIFGFLTLAFYVFFLIWLYMGLLKMKRNHVSYGLPKTQFSIIIPFRNEAEHLPKLLDSLSNLNYPKELFEVILVDDNSEDYWKMEDGRWKMEILIIKNCRKTNSPKKDAIETAIQVAKNDWIVTTDADCVVQKNWLRALDAKIVESKAKMLVGGVQLETQKSFLYHFQNLDFLSLQSITAGSFGIGKPFLCNGANFAYEKSFYKALNGFEGNTDIASGDDVFLLQKAIQKRAEKVHYVTTFESMVYTKCESSWQSLFHQRVRWASKSGAYLDWFSKSLAIVVFLTNLFWVCGLWFVVCDSIKFEIYIYFILIKFLVDYLILYKSALYFKRKMGFVLLSSLVYPFFTSAVALYSLFGKYTWKGRSFKK